MNQKTGVVNGEKVNIFCVWISFQDYSNLLATLNTFQNSNVSLVIKSLQDTPNYFDSYFSYYDGNLYFYFYRVFNSLCLVYCVVRKFSLFFFVPYKCFICLVLPLWCIASFSFHCSNEERNGEIQSMYQLFRYIAKI